MASCVDTIMTSLRYSSHVSHNNSMCLHRAQQHIHSDFVVWYRYQRRALERRKRRRRRSGRECVQSSVSATRGRGGGVRSGSSAGSNVLELRDVWYKHPTTNVVRSQDTREYVLEGVDMCLKENEIGLLTGRSGSGKTTLLNIAAGFIKQTKGSVTYHSPDPAAATRTRAASVPPAIPPTIGFVFQFPERHFLTDTVFDELTFGLNPSTPVAAQASSAAPLNLDIIRLRHALELLDVDRLIHSSSPSSSRSTTTVQQLRNLRLSELSGGFKRRLAIAIQVAKMSSARVASPSSSSKPNSNPKARVNLRSQSPPPGILLMDEPLAGLDWQAKKSILSLIKQLTNKHTQGKNDNVGVMTNSITNQIDGSGSCGVLIVSHEIDELRSIVDKWWILDEKTGKITQKTGK